MKSRSSANPDTRLIIDCSHLGHAAWHTMGDLSHDEERTGVIFGFLLQMFRVCRRFDTGRVVFCWDSRKQYRRDFYPEHKADRKRDDGPDPDYQFFRRQMALLRDEVIPAMGFRNSFVMTGFEADDVIAFCVDKEPDAVVVSSDSDMYQLLDRCSMYAHRNKKLYTGDWFRKEYGIEPSLWVDVLSIAGTHNNVKGIDGAGIKKALAYLKGELPKGEIWKRIESPEGVKIRERNRKLIKLPFEYRDVMFIDDALDLDAWQDVFMQYDFRSLLQAEEFSKLRKVFFRFQPD